MNNIARSGGDYFPFLSDDDRKARALMKEDGFDPDDINKVEGMLHMTPMHYYCRHGNLKMIQYLFSRGADCRKTDRYGSSPMYLAAYGGHFEVIKWLVHYGGAKEDIRKYEESCGGFSALRIALEFGFENIVKWMILNEALSTRYDDVFDATMMRNHLGQASHSNWEDDKRLAILSWAQGAITIHDNFQLFLKGTIVSTSFYETGTTSKRMKLSPSSSLSSPLVIFNGKSGILELISEYVGIPSAKDLRTYRQVNDLLSAFIEDVPFAPYVPGTDEEEDEDDY